MKINIEKNLVEFTPENPDETIKLQSLWRVLVDCARFSRKLVPIGEYIPQQSEFARFVVEGEKSDGIDVYPEVYVDEERQCICYTCNKYVMLKKGEQIPPCCGKLMETVD